MCESDYRKQLTSEKPKKPVPTFAERLLAKVRVAESGCWEWTASHVGSTGYGKIVNMNKTLMPAHRASYQLFVGPIPDGLEIDHLCRNPSCVNPEHLEPVTGRENKIRAMPYRVTGNEKKTHCPQGHPYDEENTRLYTAPTGYTGRNCRACSRARDVRREQAAKAARAAARDAA